MNVFSFVILGLTKNLRLVKKEIERSTEQKNPSFAQNLKYDDA